MSGDYISTETLSLGVQAVVDFFPAEWGGRKGITEAEARAVLTCALIAMGQIHPNDQSGTKIPSF